MVENGESEAVRFYFRGRNEALTKRSTNTQAPTKLANDLRCARKSPGQLHIRPRSRSVKLFFNSHQFHSLSFCSSAVSPHLDWHAGAFSRLSSPQRQTARKDCHGQRVRLRLVIVTACTGASRLLSHAPVSVSCLACNLIQYLLEGWYATAHLLPELYIRAVVLPVFFIRAHKIAG